RQASLAPQLRERPRPEPPPSAEPPAGPAHRTPEEARDRMSAYRAGWLRGGGSSPGAPEPGPRTTPEPRPLSEGDPA
ncbi:hypothetical protein ACWC1D_36110, partial [Streptomyces sp. NPDC001478]